MEIIKLTYPSGCKDDYLKEIYVHEEEFNLQFGTVFLKKGTRIPEAGFTRHYQKKIVFLAKGEVNIFLEDKPDLNRNLKEGEVFVVDYYEGHGGVVLKDAKIIYVLFGKKEK
jgi:quercetin dioxygenase-like cupin family protein